MTKPDLAAAARQLNALVERMQAAVTERLPPDQDVDDIRDPLVTLLAVLLRLLDGPEQRAAQGALKAALEQQCPSEHPEAGRCELSAGHGGWHRCATQQWPLSGKLAWGSK